MWESICTVHIPCVQSLETWTVGTVWALLSPTRFKRLFLRINHHLYIENVFFETCLAFISFLFQNDFTGSFYVLWLVICVTVLRTCFSLSLYFTAKERKDYSLAVIYLMVFCYILNINIYIWIICRSFTSLGQCITKWKRVTLFYKTTGKTRCLFFRHGKGYHLEMCIAYYKRVLFIVLR